MSGSAISSPLKIVHVVENLERGGLERMVIDLATAQHAAGHHCRVLCLFQRGALAQELVAQGIEVEACDKRRGIDLRAIRRMRAGFRSAPDVVMHTHNAIAHYHAVLAATGLPMRCIINTRHGMGAAQPHSRGEWLYRRTLRRTDVAAAVCDAARMRFEAQGSRPRSGWITVPNGIRTEVFSTADESARQRLRAQLQLPEKTRIVGTVGRLNPIKDQASLLRAFARVHREIPEAALVLVGDGPLREELEALGQSQGIASAIRFLGDRSDVAALLPGFDVFVLSSLSEGYSMALLEASASGLPIVATDVGGNREIVADGRTGLIVPAGQVDGIADAISQLLRTPDAAARMGFAGREWALREASIQAMARRYEALYRMTRA